MDQDTRSALAKLTKTIEAGFASLGTRMEKGFAAVAEDIAEVKDRLTSVESKIAGTNRRLDEEVLLRADLALPRRVADLEQETFGASRHPKHVPLK